MILAREIRTLLNIGIVAFRLALPRLGNIIKRRKRQYAPERLERDFLKRLRVLIAVSEHRLHGIDQYHQAVPAVNPLELIFEAHFFQRDI
jgi:hypothetical protein